MFLSSFFPMAFALRVAYASPATTAPPAALITPAPLIPRALDSYFIGYAMFDDGATSSYTCDSDTFTILSSRYAACAYWASDVITSCYFNSAIASGWTYSCSNYCVTNLIFASVEDPSPASFIGCGERPVGLKVLRVSEEDLPTGGAVQSFVSSVVTKFVTVTPTQTSIPYDTTSSSSSTASSSATSSQTSTPPPPKSNAPIIGGAVAGSLIFLGLIGAGAFFFFRKRRTAASVTPYGGPDQAIATSLAPALPQAPYSPPPAYGPNSASPVSGTADGKYAHVAEYSMPEMTHEAHGQSAPLSVATMSVSNQNPPGVVNSNVNRRSELA